MPRTGSKKVRSWSPKACPPCIPIIEKSRLRLSSMAIVSISHRPPSSASRKTGSISIGSSPSNPLIAAGGTSGIARTEPSSSNARGSIGNPRKLKDGGGKGVVPSNSPAFEKEVNRTASITWNSSPPTPMDIVHENSPGPSPGPPTWATSLPPGVQIVIRKSKGSATSKRLSPIVRTVLMMPKAAVPVPVAPAPISNSGWVIQVSSTFGCCAAKLAALAPCANAAATESQRRGCFMPPMIRVWPAGLLA